MNGGINAAYTINHQLANGYILVMKHAEFSDFWEKSVQTRRLVS